jgi:hypothetical protein
VLIQIGGFVIAFVGHCRSDKGTCGKARYFTDGFFNMTYLASSADGLRGSRTFVAATRRKD